MKIRTPTFPAHQHTHAIFRARLPRTALPLALAALTFLPGIGTPLHAQDNAPDTVIRSESRLVLVDAVAIDKKGKFARDLAQKNFRVWEDGKEQKITSFSLESSGVSPERPSKHYIVMYFDTSSGAGQMNMRQQAIRFIDGYASSDRYMAVLNYNYDGGMHVGQNFTTEADKLRKALANIQGTSASTPTNTTTTPARGRGASATTNTSIDSFVTRDILGSLRNVAASLASIRGRKALVLFGAGPPVGSDVEQDVAATIRALNKANVAVYTAGSGTNLNAPDTSAPSSTTPARGRGAPTALPAGSDLATSIDSMGRALAEGTGGLTFISTNDLAESLGKVAQEQDEYYLFGYTPTIESAEGSCHELKVKVDRGDLEVRARKGYCTSKPADVLSGKPAGKDLETKAASGTAATLSARMQLPWFYSAPNLARVNLAMDINASAVKFHKDKGKFHGEFDLAGVAYKQDGSVAARISDAVKLDFDTQQQVDAFLGAPYHYENQFEITPGQYNFRMAFSSGDQGFGKVEMPVKIEPWNGQSLSLSGLALSHDAHPAADLASALDVSLLEGLRPLVSKGTEVVPTGTPEFQPTEKAFVYFEAYEPLLAAVKPDATLPLLGMRARVLDASGQAKVDTNVKMATSFMQAGNPIIAIQSPVPIATLTAGKYKLEISVMRQTGDPVIRTIDFAVR